MKEIYLAGGCFWGVEEYFNRIDGVENTVVGYANGDIENPSYEQVCSGKTNHVETVYIEYDEKKISLKEIIKEFFSIIDPISVNRQGGDIGSQYRTGIYYSDKNDLDIINNIYRQIEKEYKDEIATELLAIKSFYKAEEYHQRYLKKNPGGYCHIDMR